MEEAYTDILERVRIVNGRGVHRYFRWGEDLIIHILDLYYYLFKVKNSCGVGNFFILNIVSIINKHLVGYSEKFFIAKKNRVKI